MLKIVRDYRRKKRIDGFKQAVATRYGLSDEKRIAEVIQTLDNAYNELIVRENAIANNAKQVGYVTIANAPEHELIADKLRKLAKESALTLEDIEVIYDKCDCDMDMLQTVLWMMSKTLYSDEKVMSDMARMIKVYDKDLQKYNFFIKFKAKWNNRK